MSKHIASYAYIGVTGRRVGTHYVHKPEDIAKAMSMPFFRFRNVECEQVWREWTATASHEGAVAKPDGST